MKARQYRAMSSKMAILMMTMDMAIGPQSMNSAKAWFLKRSLQKKKDLQVDKEVNKAQLNTSNKETVLAKLASKAP